MGPGDQPLVGLTVGQTMTRAAQKFGDHEAVVFCEQKIRKNFFEINHQCENLAAGFVALGLKRGDRIGIWGPNSYQWYLTQFAAAKAGLILVNINPSYRTNELKYCLKQVAVKAIVCSKNFKTSNYYSMLEEIAPEIKFCKPNQLDSKEIPSLKTVIMMEAQNQKGTFSFDDVMDVGGSDAKKQILEFDEMIQFDDPCNIQFTSGTTGLPKGALLSHHNVINNAYFQGVRMEYAAKRPNICVPVPLYHCFGCVIGTIAAALFGSKLLFPSSGFDPKAIINCFRNEKPNMCFGTPTMFVDILKEYRKDPFDLSSMYSGVMAGAPCPEELVMAVINELNMKNFITVYGMTETSPVSFACFPADEPSVRSSTIGYPLDHTEVKVVDREGKITPTGVPGELLVRGYCNFLGYWDDPNKTKEMIGPDRWLKTGDIATINENGYGMITGRIKDVIIRGGENIYPAEIENLFITHPEILEAQAVGVPDNRMGEEMAVWIRRKDQNSNLTEESLKKWCKGKMAHYKIPKYVLFKEEFPSTVTGKIQKFVMKEETIKELKLK